MLMDKDVPIRLSIIAEQTGLTLNELLDLCRRAKIQLSVAQDAVAEIKRLADERKQLLQRAVDDEDAGLLDEGELFRTDALTSEDFSPTIETAPVTLVEDAGLLEGELFRTDALTREDFSP